MVTLRGRREHAEEVEVAGELPAGDEETASRRYLALRLAILQHRVEVAVARRQGGEGTADPWPGLHVSDEKAHQLLRTGLPMPLGADGGPGDLEDPRRAYDEESWSALMGVEAEADGVEEAGGRLRLRELARRFSLDGVALDVLVAALAPELDRRFEQLYGYLNDDITRRHATVSTALELVGVAITEHQARACLGRSSPLVRSGLVKLDGGERPWPGRELVVADRVVAWCLGEDTAEPQVLRVVTGGEDPAGADLVLPPMARELGRWMGEDGRLLYLRERAGASGRWMGTAAWWAHGVGSLVFHLERLSAGEDPSELAGEVVREATLRGLGLVAGPVEALAVPGAVLEVLGKMPGGVVLHGRGSWNALWCPVTPMVVSVPMASDEELASQWASALEGANVSEDLDAQGATSQIRLSPEEIGRAAGVARAKAEVSGEPIDAHALRAAALEHNNPGLERLARRVEPALSWDDLVLPDTVSAHLHEIAARARHRDTVLGRWQMRPGGQRGRGVVALFCGVPGTGKTVSAEVLAAELGVDLYTVDLAGVVDKYVGETEKNLERIFTEADGVGGVLLFDEADALFAKRSEVRGANDRYANVEVAYLLQRMERFDGLALLTTNLRSNIDEAFVRRLDAVVEFPLPDAALRRDLWERSLGSKVPRGDDLDLGFLSETFPMSGGNIHSVCLSAGYRAAESGEPVSMRDAVRCVAREYRKLGRLCTEAEFGRYWPLVAT